uniref:Uncharacterized protein n=1 Tax=Globisporangium ultimum (strain ATCC 200006 / CBS 805.95 / DAOM BR144) TaxID=431595 RepID=K3WXA5_GLOUD
MMMKAPSREVRFTAAQQAVVTLEKIRVQGTFMVVNVLLLLLILYTSYRFPSKYMRVTGECESNWLALDSKQGSHEIICCDAKNGFHGVPCYKGMDLTHVLSSTQGAWVIPMTALVFNYVAMILGPNASLPRVRVLVRRALLYLFLMLMRTFVLYVGLNEIERRLVRVFVGDHDHSCWYAPLRRNKRCLPHFDHSDHVVLLISHYLAISIFEWFALSIESPMRTVKKIVLQCWILLIAFIATYTLFFTASFFHSAMENIVALLVAQVCIMLPLYLLSQDRFAKVKALQLKYFVLPPVDGLKAE